MSYTNRQLMAVREMQELFEVPGTLTDEACIEYLDWHMATCSPAARGITSIDGAKSSGLKDGLTIHELQFRKLQELVR